MYGFDCVDCIYSLISRILAGRAERREGDNLTMTGQIENITGIDEKTSLIVNNVSNGKRRICKRMKVWMGKNKTLFHSLRIGQIIRIQGSVYSFLEPEIGTIQ